ncbi:MAG: sodium:proton antiporter [Gemmatimonadota bacterium]|nr:sodium:proton antiporter [Gemmatimonadota bacterium]MDH3428203.1 sodium:proton antiporter [Gemmatimonadota bacterium]
MTRARIRWGGLAVAAALIVAAVVFAGDFPTNGEHYGFWSVVPPVLALVLAFALREVISALFIGIVLGGVISGKLNVVQEFLIPSIGSPGYGLILLVYLWALGGLVGLWTRTGGAVLFARWAGARIVRGPRTAKLFTWIMGMVFHQGGSISTVLTGATVRPVSDANRVAHEEMAYIVDSTGSPAATVIPFNVWPIYVGGLVAGTVPVISSADQGIAFFLKALPFNFYAIFAVLFTLLFAFDRGPAAWPRRMRAAMHRTRETGDLDREGAEPLAAGELSRIETPEGYTPALIDFFGPMGVLLGVAIIPFVKTYFIDGSSTPTLPIAEAFVLAVLAAIGIALARGMSLRVAMDGFITGCKGVTIGAVVLGLAVTLKSVADAVGTAAYVVDTVGPWIPPVTLPASLLVMAMFVAFSTGTSWGTYAVLFPVSMPLAWAVLPDPMFLTLCFGAVTGGAVFGDQCSPISDTTILSSLVSGCDLMDHVLTQLPPALMAAGLAALAYTLAALFVV